jgi:hypothetical protein
MSMTEPLIDVVQEELEAFRRDGRPVHLAHAARALEEAISVVRSSPVQDPEVAHTGRVDAGLAER